MKHKSPADRQLHIGISARALSLPVSGVKEYTSEIISCLLQTFPEHRFTIYHNSADFCGAFPKAHEVFLTAPHRFLWDHWALPARVRHDKPDVMWYPHNVISVGHNIPSVVTITDLLYFPLPEYPEQTYARLDSLYMRRFMARSVRIARRVMAISDWTAHDIRQLWPNLDPAKIRTVYLAQSPIFGPASSAEVEEVKARYDLRQPFFLYVGSFSRRKNIPLLINAFAKVAGLIPHDLVLVGGGRTTVPELSPDRLIAEHRLGQRVRQLGVISDSDLVHMYSGATAFIFPSLYEGFGIPILEAFACGCPVISSTAASLPELCGDAARVFDPNSVDSLAAHILELANDQALRDRLAQAGFKRSAEFSYLRTSRALMDLLIESV